jgi:hypothetical protein
MASMTAAIIQTLHHSIGTYYNKVDVFVALSQHSANIMVQAGVPREKIRV